jgi:cytochrome c553
MKRLLVSFACAVAIAGCTEREQPATPAATAAAPSAASAAGDPAAGKAFAETGCKGCHGLDGGSVAPGVPHLAAQQERYLLGALKAYKEGKRAHAALKVIAERMSEADIHNVSAYYASLPAAGLTPAKDVSNVSPYERGKARAAACAKCHGDDGNSTAPGVPGLAGQQVRYLIVALQEYVRGERKSSPMHAVMRTLSPVDMEAVAIYFASHAPAERPVPAGGDPAAGGGLSAVCSGCHGLHGTSADSMTPNLAGQDFKYLVAAIKAYRTTRKREKMRLYITGLGEKDILNIAAYYATQKSGPAERGQTMVRDLTEKCDRCHTASADNPAMVVPKIAGQDRDYLVMALRAYRDDRRESTAMHKMSLPHGDAVIESIASYYASQRAK